MSGGPNKSEGWKCFSKKAGRDAYSGTKVAFTLKTFLRIKIYLHKFLYG